jgi:thiol-disulfide isomerase/thioredoxin
MLLKPAIPIAVLLFSLGMPITVCAGQLKPFRGDTIPPALVLKDIDGNSHRLGDYRGKVVLLNFWATWCPPCRAEMPSIWRLNQRLGHQRFQVIAVNTGESRDVIRAFLPETMQRDFVVLMDRNAELLERWRIVAYPTSYIIDRAGNIRYRLYGALQWDAPETIEKIRALLR